ncbi:MAG TPA: extensin family protein [Bradyrhizobium sp.]
MDDLFGNGQPRPRGAIRAAKVPLPQPRPTEAPQPDNARAAPAEPEKTAEPAAPKPPEQSACRLALTEEVAIAPSIPDIHGPGGCGGEDLVRLEAIVLPSGHRVTVTPPAILRCKMASEIADWVRTDVVGLAAPLGSEPAVLDNFDSYECRGFNRIPGAHLSEHGRANALDVRAIKLANGRSIELTDRTVPSDLRERFLQSVCARFMTVLGPGSDWYHEEHIHLDLMERRNNYKICQWNVWDPLPKIAPLMPAARPDEAPPREVAGKADTDKSDGDGPKGSEDAKSAPAQPASAKSATKKRR